MQVVIQQLCKKYGSKEVLNGINLTLGTGMSGLLGPNGAGKSTLMQILATVIPKTSGEVQIGKCRLGRDEREIRSLLGYLPQEFGVYRRLTGAEYLDYAASMKGITNGKARKEAVAGMLRRVNLEEKRDVCIAKYSGGMRQRIGIAQALLGDPQFIIVDEPTAGLDPEERLRFRDMLAELGKERTVLLSTHVVADIDNNCQSLAIMNGGQIVFHGTQDELLQRVQGQVWTVQTDNEKLAELKEAATLVTGKRSGAGYEARVLCSSAPLPGAVQAAAGLEDGYIAVMRAGNRI
ncbi:ABC transporter ATP-binding protein [Paenibacillus sp. MMS20-IR301]|uniref:ABC transporter ATP-binding protein n=1 Tax=Paenibacillus sp. MMS20-IR301 TaxID=2895946 RepID=UPI0028E507D6|nr:ABC transporter ATP-binding protein [Paenibacillus sp. MMS20-IR301]WNS46084.1 ABC transporter ATP-binding protein [Paenibacillus sp. MMS20-IR301]